MVSRIEAVSAGFHRNIVCLLRWTAVRIREDPLLRCRPTRMFPTLTPPSLAFLLAGDRPAASGNVGLLGMTLFPTSRCLTYDSPVRFARHTRHLVLRSRHPRWPDPAPQWVSDDANGRLSVACLRTPYERRRSCFIGEASVHYEAIRGLRDRADLREPVLRRSLRIWCISRSGARIQLFPVERAKRPCRPHTLDSADVRLD